MYLFMPNNTAQLYWYLYKNIINYMKDNLKFKNIIECWKKGLTSMQIVE